MAVTFNNNNSNNFIEPIKVELSGIVKKLKDLNSSIFFWTDQDLIGKLDQIEAKDLTQVLHQYFHEVIEENLIEDPVAFLDRLAQTLPAEKLNVDLNEILQEAKDKFEEAKIYLETTEPPPPSFKTYVTSVINAIINIIESIIAAFGIGDFFKPAETEMQANMKSSRFLMLLGLFGTLSTWMLPLLGPGVGGAIIGGILLAISGLSILWPHIKPMPTHLPCDADNLTLEVEKKGFVSQGRKIALDQIANTLMMNRHAILVGKSRVGKSLTAKAFAQAVARGDYPELQGKVVFKYNTSKIVGEQDSIWGGGNKVLNRISTEMGRHSDDIILVLDEIHTACKGNEKTAEQLKTYLDEDGEFPHVIGISTLEEYEKHVVKNQAFSLRFDRIDIVDTDRDETIRILSSMLLKSRAKPLIGENALELIYEKGNKDKVLPQPAASIKILKQCINRTEKTQQSPKELRIIDVSNRLQSLYSLGAASRGRKATDTALISRLKRELEDLKANVLQEQQEREKLFKARALLDRVTSAAYRTILKINEDATNKNRTLYLLLQEFLGKSLETYIQKKSQEVGIKSVIDRKLIEEVAEIL